MTMIEDLNELEAQAVRALANVLNQGELAEWKSAYLGKQGALTRLSKGLGTLAPEQRPLAGQKFNQARQKLEQSLAEAEERLKRAARMDELEADQVDVTLPGRAPSVGRLHPSTIVLRNVIETFAEMGFQVWDSPEVELDEVNFGLLNFPPDHPARDMQDTFYIADCNGQASGDIVLRTHTSPGQIHAMREMYPNPIRIILPGLVFRYEQVTVRSEMQFHQVEGLAVGKHITMADLKGTLINFSRRFFGEQYAVRFRPSYFPFTEPSVEMDVECIVCGGQGCAICKRSGWLEILGAGMVHPVVLSNGGYDPDVYSGFAFGMGVERPAILKHRIDDIRLFYSNDLRFLEQYR